MLKKTKHKSADIFIDEILRFIRLAALCSQLMSNLMREPEKSSPIESRGRHRFTGQLTGRRALSIFVSYSHDIVK